MHDPVLYVHQVDTTTFPVRSIDEVRMEVVDTFGFSEYAGNRGSDIVGV